MASFMFGIGLIFIVSSALVGAQREVPLARIERTESDTGSECIPPVGEDMVMRDNFTARCVAPPDVTVVWLINDYQMVDRDQFGGDTDIGVFIEDNTANRSSLNLYDHGANFLRNISSTNIINFGCQSVIDETNVRRSPDFIQLYVGLQPVQEPSFTFSSCNLDTGEVTFDITYKPSNSCIEDLSEVTYTLSGDCSGTGLSYTCATIPPINVTLTATIGSITRSRTDIMNPPCELEESPTVTEPLIDRPWFLAVIGVVMVIAGLAIGLIIALIIIVILIKKQKSQFRAKPISATNTIP